MTRLLIVGVVSAFAQEVAGAEAIGVPGPLNLRAFADHAVSPGTENEDWQPAFQEAIEQAYREIRPIYVPAGEYVIRKPIVILPAEPSEKGYVRNTIRMFGDGIYHTVITQAVETENVIDWTGLEYEKPCNYGQLSALTLTGGNTALNIKWHNYFTMDSVYIHGPQVGVYAEGWSSRFVNSTIRWCFQAGIRAGAHFNNCVIRDCYFSRDGIGFQYASGHGNRIEGCCFEACAKAAIFLRGGRSFTINNCYFEGNGYKDKHKDLFNVEGSANTIHLDYACKQVTIHDNIIRANLDKEGALLSIGNVFGGRFYDNMLYNAPNGIKLRAGCETNENAKPIVARFIVENNSFDNVENALPEEQPGLLEKALTLGSAFRLRTKNTCEGNPMGTVQPESLGDEILDTTSKRWYKSVGPKKTDWVAMNE